MFLRDADDLLELCLEAGGKRGCQECERDRRGHEGFYTRQHRSEISVGKHRMGLVDDDRTDAGRICFDPAGDETSASHRSTVRFHSLYDRFGNNRFDGHDHQLCIGYCPVIGGDPVLVCHSTIDARLYGLAAYHLVGKDRYGHLALT